MTDKHLDSMWVIFGLSAMAEDRQPVLAGLELEVLRPRARCNVYRRKQNRGLAGTRLKEGFTNEKNQRSERR